MQPLDDADRSLLRLLQGNNRLTTVELAEKVNLSQSAVQRRLSRLRKEKMIEADVSILSSRVTGLTVTCVVDVSLLEGGSRPIENFKKAMIGCPEVTQCYYVTGSYDFVLIVNTRDMAQFEAFQKRYLLDNPNLKHFYTHVSMEKVKSTWAVAI